MATNRIHIEVKFEQAGAVDNAKKLNQAISDIGVTTQKATKEASKGVSGMSLTLQQAAAEASSRTQKYANGIALIGDSAIAAAKRVSEMNSVIKELPDQRAAAFRQTMEGVTAATQKLTENARVLRADFEGTFEAAKAGNQRLGELRESMVKGASAAIQLDAGVTAANQSIISLTASTGNGARALDQFNEKQKQAAATSAAMAGRSKGAHIPILGEGSDVAEKRVAALRGAIGGMTAEGEQRVTALRGSFDSLAQAAEKNVQAIRQYSKEVGAMGTAAAARAGAVRESVLGPTTASTIAAANQRLAAFNATMKETGNAAGKGVQSVQRIDVLLKDIAPAAAVAAQHTEKLNRSFKDGKPAVDQYSRSMAGLGQVLSVYAAYEVGKRFIEAAATLDSLNKQLEVTEGSTEAAAKMFERLSVVALQPGLSLESTISSFTKLRTAELGVEEAIRVIQGFGKAVAQMGKGGAEANLVFVQMVQSLGKTSGIMQEDLKFIVEKVPQVARAMRAVYQTSSTEELRKRFPELTSKEFWLRITAEMEKLKSPAASLATELTRLGDSWLKVKAAFGEGLAAEALPAMRKALDLLTWIGDAFRSLPPWVKASTIEIGLFAGAVLLVATNIGKVTTAMTAMTVVATKNPWILGVLLTGTAAIATYEHLKGLLDKLGAAGGIPGPRSMAGIAGAAGRVAETPPGADKKVPKPLTDEQLRAALDMKRHIEKAEQDSRDALRDSIIDRQKYHAALLLDLKRGDEYVAAQVQIILDEQKKKYAKADVWVDAKGIERALRPAGEVIENRFKETLNRVGLARQQAQQEALDRVREGEEAAARDVAEMWMESWQNANKVRIDAETQLLQTLNEAELQAIRDGIDLKHQMEMQAIDHRHQMELEAIDAMDDRTLKQKLDLNTKRLEIEIRYIDAVLEQNKKLLDMEEQRAQAQLRVKAILESPLGTEIDKLPEFQRAKQAIADLYTLRKQNLDTTAEQQKEMARSKSISDRNKIVRTEVQKTFEYFKNSAEGVFDALLDKSKSVWQSMADFWKNAWLTALKHVFSTVIANGMMRIFGLPGGGAGGGTGGGTRSGGGWGNLGGIFSSGGSGGSPFGSGGWLSRIVGGPGGTAPWNPNSGRTPPIVGNGSGGYGSYGAGLAGYGRDAVGALRGLGNLGMNTGRVAGLGPEFSIPGIGAKGGMSAASGASGVGGVAGGALLLGGAALAGYGLYKGGWKGVGMATAGGAMIGAKIGAFAGPMGIVAGAAIGAAIGFTAGMIRKMFKSASEKTRIKIKEVYGVDIASAGILGQITQIIKTNYGGDINVGVYAPEVQEMVKLYAMTQGTQASGMGRPMTPVSWAMSGGSASIQPVYSGGSIVSNPYVGPTTTELAYSRSPLFVTLNPEQANQLFEGKVVQVIGNNPTAVGDASAAAASGSSARRSHTQSAILEPMTVLS